MSHFDLRRLAFVPTLGSLVALSAAGSWVFRIKDPEGERAAPAGVFRAERFGVGERWMSRAPGRGERCRRRGKGSSVCYCDFLSHNLERYKADTSGLPCSDSALAQSCAAGQLSSEQSMSMALVVSFSNPTARAKKKAHRPNARRTLPAIGGSEFPSITARAKPRSRDRRRPQMAAKNYHALSQATAKLSLRQQRRAAPRGARAWSRALPRLEVSTNQRQGRGRGRGDCDQPASQDQQGLREEARSGPW
jgi:hypothetical protein